MTLASLFYPRRTARRAAFGAFAALVIAEAAGACGLETKGLESGDVSSEGGASSSGPGAGGEGGGAGSAAPLCFPSATIPCYEGTSETEGVGVCRGGLKTCQPDGMSYGVCSGQILPTPENCVSTEDEDCDGYQGACTGDPTWALRIGGPDYDTAISVAVDPSDNIIVTGFFKGTASFGGQALKSNGDGDIFIAKYDSKGSLLWNKTFGGPEFDAGLGVATDASGNIFATGFFRNNVDFGPGPFKSGGGYDIFLLKFDPNGTLLFAKHFGEDGDQFSNGVAVGEDGGPVIAGSFVGNVDFDTGAPTLTANGNYDIFVTKFGPDGEYQWARRYGDGGNQGANSVAADKDGHIVVTGNANGKFYFGNTEVTTAGDDVFVASFKSDGTLVYGSVFGDGSDQAGQAIALDAKGLPIVAGTFHGKITLDQELSAEGYDIFLAALDADGKPRWSRRFGGLGDHWVRGLAVDPFGNILFAGYSYTTVGFFGESLSSATRDVLVGKLNPDGGGVWAQLIGDAASWEQYGIHIAADSKGYIVMSGEFEGTLPFKGTPLTAMGGREGFIAKLAP